MSKEISQAVVKRLPVYYRYLEELLDRGVERISSGDLSSLMNITASQIRQDLNNYGGFGQQGYGYNVLYLHDEIGKILGLDRAHNIIVIGVGNIGRAISNYSKFEDLGFHMTGLFDIKKELIGQSLHGIKIRDISDLPEFSKKSRIDIAALTLPKDAAESIVKMLVAIGVKAIWNFSLTELQVPSDVVVENVHLSDSLMRLSYKMTNN
jgi:redox-sensing transcriptional repressor